MIVLHLFHFLLSGKECSGKRTEVMAWKGRPEAYFRLFALSHVLFVNGFNVIGEEHTITDALSYRKKVTIEDSGNYFLLKNHFVVSEISLFSDIKNWFSDIRKSFFDIQKWFLILDIRKSASKSYLAFHSGSVSIFAMYWQPGKAAGSLPGYGLWYDYASLLWYHAQSHCTFPQYPCTENCSNAYTVRTKPTPCHSQAHAINGQVILRIKHTNIIPMSTIFFVWVIPFVLFYSMQHFLLVTYPNESITGNWFDLVFVHRHMNWTDL